MSNPTTPLLDLAIPTWKPDALERFCPGNYPPHPGVRYVISWQRHGDAPIPDAIARRTDILVFRTDCIGLSANRNNAIDHCTAPVILHSDDDLIYTPERLQAVIDTFAVNPDVDVAMFEHLDHHGLPAKNYPTRETTLGIKMPRGLWCATFELAARRTGRAAPLRFDTRFGPGAELLGSAEDEYYLHEARNGGLNCRFFPIIVATHPDIIHIDRAGERIDDSVLRGCGAIIAAETHLSPKGYVWAFLKARLMWKQGQTPLLNAIRQIIKGHNYYRKTEKHREKTNF